MKKLISVRQALEDPAWLGSMLGAESFAVMRTLLIATMGEALTAAEMQIFTQLTGRAETPGEAVEELWVIAGAGTSLDPRGFLLSKPTRIVPLNKL